MLQDKIREYKNAKAKVREIRSEFNRLEKNFGCYDTWGMLCSGNPCDSNGTEIPRCRQYDINVCCQCKDCRNQDWNMRHYRAYIKLCNAKMDKFLAFVNIFKRSK